MTSAEANLPALPRTRALQKALQDSCSGLATADLLFLEAWEAAPRADIGVALRVSQIRRANPDLAAEIRAELGSAPEAS